MSFKTDARAQLYRRRFILWMLLLSKFSRSMTMIESSSSLCSLFSEEIFSSNAKLSFEAFGDANSNTPEYVSEARLTPTNERERGSYCINLLDRGRATRIAFKKVSTMNERHSRAQCCSAYLERRDGYHRAHFAGSTELLLDHFSHHRTVSMRA